MNDNKYNLIELNIKLGKIKLNRDLKVLSAGALTLVAISNFMLMHKIPIEQNLIESGTFFIGAFGFSISAFKKNKEVTKLKKLINKLRYK